MNYEDTKVIRVGNRSYLNLPGNIPVEVDDCGKLKRIDSLPQGEALKPYPYTGQDFPSSLALIVIEAVLYVAGLERKD